jgi:hypothetical protein
VPRSPTVFNLGYTAEDARKYPWVDRLSGGTRGDGHPRRFWEEQHRDAIQALHEQQAPATGRER